MSLPTDPLRRIARALGDLRERVVFIGGSVAPILQSLPPMPRARVTDDVDALLVSATYSESAALEEAVAALGFRRDITSRHAHRWIAPSGDKLDLVPFGKHAGATGSALDHVAAATAIETELEPGLTILHVSAPAFIAMKLAAHSDRFADDPFASRDLQDVFAVIASRPEIVAEMKSAPIEIRSFSGRELEQLLAHPDAEEIVAAHLNDARPLAPVVQWTLERAREMAGP